MSRYLNEKRRGRRAVHDRMSRPALYLATRNASPVGCRVRLHTSSNALGAKLQSDAEREEETPKLVFDLLEIAHPARNAIVSFAFGEAYRVDNTFPRDDQFQKANAVRLDSSDSVGLPIPSIS